ncbi:MAG: sensor domain-containing diguanylate cyclase [Nitrospirae bacterium]|nr:sensor domain-containing diguanylate cyclase [Nitrospirota bacterium]
MIIFMILFLTGVSIFFIIKAYHVGKSRGFQEVEKNLLEAENKYNRMLYYEKSLRETLQIEKERYIHFLVNIPNIVKKLISDLSSEEIVSSIFRLTKSLIQSEIIELYIYDGNTKSLILTHHSNSKKKKGCIIKPGEEIVGLAAENRMVISQKLQHLRGTDDIEFAAPILFKERLVGVLGLGRFKQSDGNEMRFLTMIAELAGVSLQNCEFLGIAKKEAITDALTGLYNRRFFFEKAREASHKSIKYHTPISIFIFDIDHFKKYNDMHGHPEGDYILKELSQILKENSREGDIIARYGGEEFIVLMPDTDKDGAIVYAEKIRKIIENYPFNHREEQPLGCISVSGGVATFPLDGSSIDAVIRCADEALYESKRSGRNMVTRYEPFQFSTQ